MAHQRSVSSMSKGDLVSQLLKPLPSFGHKRRDSGLHLGEALLMARLGDTVSLPSEVHILLRRAECCFLLGDHDLDHDPDSAAVKTAAHFGLVSSRNYHPYRLSRAAPVFATREASLLYCEALIDERRLEAARNATEALEVAQRCVSLLTACREDAAAMAELNALVTTRPHVAVFTWQWIRWRTAFHSLDWYESKSARRSDKSDYRGAIEVMKLLLYFPLCPHRRGKLWERLTLDLTHIGDRISSLHFCWNALNDPIVENHFRLSIQSRIRNLLNYNKKTPFQSIYHIVLDPFGKKEETLYNKDLEQVHFVKFLEPGDLLIKGTRLGTDLTIPIIIFLKRKKRKN